MKKEREMFGCQKIDQNTKKLFLVIWSITQCALGKAGLELVKH